MIIQLRLDERLIHGQIVTSWVNTLGINTIVVANDQVAANELDRNLLMMSAPANTKVTIRSVDDVIKLLSDPRADKMGILLICGNPQDALKLSEKLNVKDINIANYKKKKSDNKVQVNQYVFADETDLNAFKQLCSGERNVFAQLLPSISKEDFPSQLEKAMQNK